LAFVLAEQLALCAVYLLSAAAPNAVAVADFFSVLLCLSHTRRNTSPACYVENTQLSRLLHQE
jgi:hypothetical protein